MEEEKQTGSNESTSSCLYIVGRYNKFSRNLCQTPWVIDGVKKMESSVQEMITGQIEKYIKFEKAKFSACGREDVDVRMLGGGRPFVVELSKPETKDVKDDLLEKIEKSINSTHDEVQVRDLQLGEKKEVRTQLRDGETDKTKGYRALCCIDRPIGDQDFEKLNQIKDLSINQKTPVRVLHRRSLLDRTRLIHKLSGKPTEDVNKFVIELTTEAGTYIKEFVHGDFGRTSPNLAEILGDCRTDIIELDVTGIVMDWPKSMDRCQSQQSEERLLTSSSPEPYLENVKRIKLVNNNGDVKDEEIVKITTSSNDRTLDELEQIKNLT